jgi:hypothetical protein
MPDGRGTCQGHKVFIARPEYENDSEHWDVWTKATDINIALRRIIRELKKRLDEK